MPARATFAFGISALAERRSVCNIRGCNARSAHHCMTGARGMSELDQHLREVKAALERALREAEELTQRVSADLAEGMHPQDEHRLDRRAITKEEE